MLVRFSEWLVEPDEWPAWVQFFLLPRPLGRENFFYVGMAKTTRPIKKSLSHKMVVLLWASKSGSVEFIKTSSG